MVYHGKSIQNPARYIRDHHGSPGHRFIHRSTPGQRVHEATRQLRFLRADRRLHSLRTERLIQRLRELLDQREGAIHLGIPSRH